ncbi:MAG: Lsr2 family protein [Propionibacteriaceae bacterium]|jgi:hypothetical protein|nr:Lsr2 family protein [Propionibacteriaceae bacterium]
MAKRVTTVLLDDIDGTPADESIVFALDGVTYQIDLNSIHAAELREAIRPYIKAGVKLSGRKSTSAAKSAPHTDRAVVRAWGNQNGYALGQRGRIPVDVLEAYQRAQG